MNSLPSCLFLLFSNFSSKWNRNTLPKAAKCSCSVQCVFWVVCHCCKYSCRGHVLKTCLVLCTLLACMCENSSARAQIQRCVCLFLCMWVRVCVLSLEFPCIYQHYLKTLKMHLVCWNLSVLWQIESLNSVLKQYYCRKFFGVGIALEFISEQKDRYEVSQAWSELLGANVNMCCDTGQHCSSSVPVIVVAADHYIVVRNRIRNHTRFWGFFVWKQWLHCFFTVVNPLFTSSVFNGGHLKNIYWGKACFVHSHLQLGKSRWMTVHSIELW